MKKTFVFILIAFMALSCGEPSARLIDSLPDIYPDYIGVTVPPETAPLNFKVNGAEKVFVELSGCKSKIEVSGDFANFPLGRWHRMLSENIGGRIEVRVKAKIGEWVEYKPFTIDISSDSIDLGIVYRRIDPGYELYSRMGIYQRILSNFEEIAVLENTEPDPGCMNCHSFSTCRPESLQLHLRGKNGGTYIKTSSYEKVFDMKNPKTLGIVYPYWHPSSRFIAYSTNDIKQSFHNIPSKVLEVYDLASDIAVFDVEKESLVLSDAVMDSTYLETFPAFSADGNSIFFCRAAKNDDFTKIRYSLCKASFNSSTGKIGSDIETIWRSDSSSASFPRPSYNGDWLLFTVSDYGNFSIWHKEADLYLMNLETGEVRNVSEINSNDTESYHSWSSSSKWIVFSSRRDDGRYTRLYFSHLNEDGTFTKPFMLPQKNPEFNTLLLQSYNIPEFCNGTFDIDKDLVYSTGRSKLKD